MSAVPDQGFLARILSAGRLGESAPGVSFRAATSGIETRESDSAADERTACRISPSLLAAVNGPEDLRRLAPHQLPLVAQELRDYLVQTVAESGGHLSAGLGTVELTLALHYVFDTPRDALVWDVGHQCYPHKIVTGRRNQMPSIRRRGGLSGFLRRDESPFDNFGAGHSSTSISAALGMAIANAHLELDRKAVAIIGDGAMTAGLAFEALDHAGATDADLLVVLNDNQMSISPNVGALSNYFARTVASGATIRPGSRRLHGALLAMHERTERNVRGMMVPGQWFEELGFSYFGPVDGHDLPNLMQVMRSVRELKGPRILHVVTEKGHGYAPAAADPVKYHGVTPFDPAIGIVKSAKPAPVTCTQVFGDWLCDMAERDSRLVAITPAMREGSGLVKFAAQFPRRYIDVGIAEQHSVTLAAGLACQGIKPVVAIYSTFLQRAYDQLIHDVAIQKLPVLFAIDRAGLVGPDGATHAGAFDLTFLRCVPGLTVMTPADGADLRSMLYTGFLHDGPAAVRYPRANVSATENSGEMRAIPIGTAEVRRRGNGVALLVFGTLLDTALRVAESIDATVVNMRFVKPLDTAMISEMAETHDLIVTIEENSIAGGAGSGVNEWLAASGAAVNILNLGLPDCAPEHGTRDEALRDAGLDFDGIRSAILGRRAG